MKMKYFFINVLVALHNPPFGTYAFLLTYQFAPIGATLWAIHILAPFGADRISQKTKLLLKDVEHKVS